MKGRRLQFLIEIKHDQLDSGGYRTRIREITTPDTVPTTLTEKQQEALGEIPRESLTVDFFVEPGAFVDAQVWMDAGLAGA